MAIRSMTGFGEAERENGRWRVAVSVRSVNHRFLDLALRLPEERREIEAEVRQWVLAKVARGRVEVRVEVDSLAAGKARLEVDEAALAELARAATELAQRGLVGAGLTFGDLLRSGQVVRLQREDPEWGADDLELIAEATRAALAALATARSSEGGRLQQFLEARLDELENVVTGLAERREAARAELAQGLRRRLQEVLEDREVPVDRLAFEVALLVERSDVQEELDRLAAHLEHLHATLAGAGAVGRRLDFLSQEVQREINTLGAKCRDGVMADAVIEAKLLCEQFREQAQNVE